MAAITYLAIAYIVMIGLVAAWSWTLARRLQHLGARLDAAELELGADSEE